MSNEPIRGIDISHWNFDRKRGKFIDWEVVRKDPLNLQFVYIKAGDGYWEGYDIRDFTEPFDGATAAGFAGVGAYLYGYTGLPASLQAGYFIKRCRERRGNLPQVVDLEDKSITGPKPTPTKATYKINLELAKRVFLGAVELLDAVDNAFGAESWVYTAAWWSNWIIVSLQLAGIDTSRLTNRNLWGADYTPPFDRPIGFARPRIWQKTDKAKIAGFPDPTVDLNDWVGTPEDFAALVGKPLPKPLSLETLSLRVDNLEAQTAGVAADVERLKLKIPV